MPSTKIPVVLAVAFVLILAVATRLRLTPPSSTGNESTTVARSAASAAPAAGSESLADRLNRNAPPRPTPRPVDPRNPKNLPKLSETVSRLDNYTNQFVDTMRNETFEKSLSRFHDVSELTNIPLTVNVGLMPTDREAGDLIARTHRFAKVAFYVTDPANPVEDSIKLISRSIDDYLAMRDKLKKQIVDLFQSQPDYLLPTHPNRPMNDLGDLISGHGIMGSDPDEIPPSTLGTQRGLLVDSMLLGLTDSRQAIDPLLKLADAISQDNFQQDFSKMVANTWASQSPSGRHDLRVMNPYYVADALDRIMSDPNDPSNAPYRAWRQAQQFKDREIIVLYPFDSPRTPYDAAGALGGPPVDQAAPVQRTLNYPSPSVEVRQPNWNREETVQKIIEFARAAPR